MSEPVHPGFTIMPLMDQRFKDGVQYGQTQTAALIIALFEDSDSACAQWALNLVKEALK